MAELQQSVIVGTWRIVRAEPPVEDPSLERFLHFSPESKHYWEHPFATQPVLGICTFRYRMTERGVFIQPGEQERGWEVPFTVDGDCLLLEAENRRWWIQRIPEAARPIFLTNYFPPPPGC